MKKITIKSAKEIISNNPEAKRLIDFVKGQGFEIYYGSHNKKNPWLPDMNPDDEGSIDGFNLVSVGKGRRSDDEIFSLFIYEDSNNMGTLPKGDLSEMIEYSDVEMNNELDSWVVNEYMAESASSIDVNGVTYSEDDYDVNIFDDSLDVYEWGEEDEWGDVEVESVTTYNFDDVVFNP